MCGERVDESAGGVGASAQTTVSQSASQRCDGSQAKRQSSARTFDLRSFFGLSKVVQASHTRLNLARRAREFNTEPVDSGQRTVTGRQHEL